VWQDSHMPHADAAAGSLMTEDAIAACLRAAGDGLTYVGGKLTARPTMPGWSAASGSTGICWRC